MGCILFDLDGTLVDSQADLTTASNAARRACGLTELSIDEVRARVGDGVKVLLQRLCPDVDDAQFALAEAAFVACYDRVCCEQTRPYPGIIEALAQLADRGVAMAVVSNKDTKWSQQIVTGCGLDRWLPVVVGGDQGKKPAPTSLKVALRQLGLSLPPAGWMVGDHDNDIRAGRAVGLRSAWCGWGFSHPADAADRELQDPAELLHLLDA